MVGGERATDEGLKEKRRKKLKHAEMRKLALAKAIAKMDDDGIMLNIYSSIEDELKAKNELLKKESEKVNVILFVVTQWCHFFRKFPDIGKFQIER